jgi:hypothetical protein
MIFLRACLAAIRLNLASLRQRIWPALVVVVGVACVVATLLSMLSMTVGLRHTWQRAGSPERAIILPATAQREGDGAVSRAEAQIIKDAPGIARDAKGRAIADPDHDRPGCAAAGHRRTRQHPASQRWAGGVGAQAGIPHHRRTHVSARQA